MDSDMEQLTVALVSERLLAEFRRLRVGLPRCLTQGMARMRASQANISPAGNEINITLPESPWMCPINWSFSRSHSLSSFSVISSLLLRQEVVVLAAEVVVAVLLAAPVVVEVIAIVVFKLVVVLVLEVTALSDMNAS